MKTTATTKEEGLKNLTLSLSLFYPLPPPKKKPSGSLRLRVGSRRGLRPRPALLPRGRRGQEAQLHVPGPLPSAAARAAVGAVAGRAGRGPEAPGRGVEARGRLGPRRGPRARRQAGEACRGGGDREARGRGCSCGGRGGGGGGGEGGGSSCCRRSSRSSFFRQRCS